MNITGKLKRKLLSDLMSLNNPVITDVFSRHISKCFYITDNSPKPEIRSFYIIFSIVNTFLILSILFVIYPSHLMYTFNVIHVLNSIILFFRYLK